MRNLKKILALVLALVMSMSLMVTANAALSDLDTVDADYEEAVTVLTDMGVFKGRTAADGSTYFAPDASITRQEVAAIMYRIASGDVTDAQDALYVEGADFSDVKSTDWAAGYIGYCAIGELVLGYNGKFNPTDEVTGYQVLAMALRAIGYDQNGEFTGDDWYTKVATTAEVLGILKNVDESVQLSKPASRELVAELIFRTIATADQVEYTNAFGYQPIKIWNAPTATLGWDQFKLDDAATNDKWGRPGVKWTYNVGEKSTTILDTPIKSYTVATTECQIATDIGQKKDATYTLYTNGVVNDTQYTVQVLDTVQKLGAQGTLVEVYEDEIVVIDTFLAEVIAVAPATYDAAGHLRSEAVIELAVYTSATSTNATTYNVALTNGKTNYTYAKGDMVLVNAYTTNNVSAQYTTGTIVANGIATTSTAITNYGTRSVADYAVILGTAQAQVGTQSYVLYNAPYHIVDGNTYNDAAWFMLDEAQYDDDNAHTWYFDQYGNLIGATDIATVYTYGIIENIQWQNPSMATGYAQATIRYMDGTTETKIIAKIDNKPTAYAGNYGVGAINNNNVAVSTDFSKNDALCGKDLYQIAANTNGTVNLTHVVDAKSTTTPKANAHIAGAKINEFGTGTAAVSAIGTGSSYVYANSNTKFLVQTISSGVASYTVVEGYLNMAKYTSSSTVVDYVYMDGDSYVDYVYVTGTPDSAAAYYGLFYLNTDEGIQAYYNSANSDYGYYVVDGILDGVAGQYKVAATASFYDGTATDTVVLTDFAGIEDELSYVKVEGGKITGIWDSVADGDNLYTSTQNTKAYENLYLDIETATGTAGTVTKSGDVLKVGEAYYNVGSITAPVVGAWADDMSDKVVYVIYDNTKVIAGASVAVAVYVVDVADQSTNSGSTAPSNTGTLTRVVEVWQGGTKIATKTFTEPGVIANTYTVGQDYATISTQKPGLAVPNAVVISDVTSVTVVAGQTTTVTYVVTVA